MAPTTARPMFVDAGGVKLHVLDWGGRGLALVFLAGFGNTAHFFDGVARRLTDGYRVLGFTRRGHGESDRPPSGYDVPNLARDIILALDALGIDRASFAGHSFAGCELVELATAHAERVDRLVFLDALYGFDERDLEVFKTDPQRVAGAPPESHASPAAYSLDFVTRYPQYRRLRSPRWDELLAHDLEQTPDGRFRERLAPEAAQEMGAGMFRHRPDWREIRCPVLAIYARQDAAWRLPEEGTEDMRRAVADFVERLDREHAQRYIARARAEIRDLEVVLLANTSHYCFLDGEDAVAGAMRRFLRGAD